MFLINKKLIAIIVIFFVCFDVGSAQAYTNKEHSFSIDQPTGWTVREDVPGVVVAFVGPTEGGFTVNIVITVESLATTVTLSQYVSAAKGQFQTTYVNFAIVSEGARVISGLDAYELVYTFTYSGVNIKDKVVILIREKKAYLIIYTAGLTTYGNYLSVFESSVGTFKFIEPTPWYIEYWYIWVILGASAAVLAFYLLRRRKAGMAPPPMAPAYTPSPPPPPTPSTYCLGCGAPSPPGVAFCPKCGRKIV